MNLENLVVSRLIGGLGNQLFQYAAGRALADRIGAHLKLDVSGFESQALRKYELGEMNIRASIASAEELRAFQKNDQTGTGLRVLLERAKRKFGLRSAAIYREPSFTYGSGLSSISAPVYLDGYWQSEQYFINIAIALRDELTLAEEPDIENKAILAAIYESNSLTASAAVSLHVRRGDYVSNAATAQYHGVCSLDYYRDAIAHVAARVANPHFFVFSDDPEWADANLHTGFQTTVVKANRADRGVFDLNLMKSCRHHIIANSSFSWWGAWLNADPGKIVIAPKVWFKGAKHQTDDLIPASWARL